MIEKIHLQRLVLNDNAIQVIRTLLYFDGFKYPLTATEIFERSKATSLLAVKSDLEFLCSNGYVIQYGIYYTIKGNLDWIASRQSGNRAAGAAMGFAKKYTRWMQMIPFVRSVFLSGSISKDYMDENSDIDYFVVIQEDRLFIARLFFVFIQRIILKNSAKHFCFNYMVTTNNLVFKDQSFYPAIELMTLKPMFHGQTFLQLLKENPWASRMFPNYPEPNLNTIPSKQLMIQKIAELFFPNWFAQWIDNKLLAQTKKRWEIRFPKRLFEQGHKNVFISKQVAKAHSTGFFDKINRQWQIDLDLFCQNNDTCLDEKFSRGALRKID